MGGGAWTRKSFVDYSMNSGRNVTDDGVVSGNFTPQEMFTQRDIAEELDPHNKIRECCDSEEHPNTKPVILALDVTGSMGGASVKVAKELNVIMTKLYEKVNDVEFMIMGIGDLAYDRAPIQASQFESDIRIAEQLDKIWFEGGGGGNGYESYTAAWYFGLKHCKLDCWNRGKKGIIITLGDEPLNPYLPKEKLKRVTGDNLESNIETEGLYKEALRKYDIYHLCIDDSETCYGLYEDEIKSTWGNLLDENHLKVVNLDSLAATIVNIVSESHDAENETEPESDAITW